jgi:predicted O-methyltransferase YrrM
MVLGPVRKLLIERGLDGAARAVRHPLLTLQARTASRWSARQFLPTEVLARATDPALWDETIVFADELESRHRERFDALRTSIRLGGSADFRLLYFLTRLTRPEVVVETGVAAGWSSAAILAGLQKNGRGRLWSSELVYDRPWLHDDYRPLVGMVVDPSLHDRWTLLHDGDRTNLPKILAEVGEIDLFHYDSDKSVDGRRFAFSAVESHLRPDAVIVVDDINDNLHFRDLVRGTDQRYVITGMRGTVGVRWSGLRTSG